jgi:regulatory protein
MSAPEQERPDSQRHTVRSVLNDPAQELSPPGRRKADKTPLEQAKAWALDYLKRPHSEKELRTKLAEKGAAPEDIEAVCALCLEYGFLDDEEYAGMVVRHYAAKGYGAGRIRQELNRRGLDRELWDEALTQLPEDTDTIDRLLAAKLRGREMTDKAQRDKAANALFRRGFSWQEIRAAMERYRP